MFTKLTKLLMLSLLISGLIHAMNYNDNNKENEKKNNTENKKQISQKNNNNNSNNNNNNIEDEDEVKYDGDTVGGIDFDYSCS